MFLLSETSFLADENMGIDSLLLNICKIHNTPILRFYNWKQRSATCGYSQSHSEITAKDIGGLNCFVIRPVGGGLVVHELSDITYSLVVPSSHDFFLTHPYKSYSILHKEVADCLSDFDCFVSLKKSDANKGLELSSCFKFPSANDVMLADGLTKLAGAAQRRTRDGLLVQGSIKLPKNLFTKREIIAEKLAQHFSKMLNSEIKRAKLSDFVSKDDVKQSAKKFEFKYL